jgi:hypothetical protein
MMQRPDEKAEFIPTPAEIEAGCEEIQATWSQDTRQARAGWYFQDLPVYFPELTSRDMGRAGMRDE